MLNNVGHHSAIRKPLNSLKIRRLRIDSSLLLLLLVGHIIYLPCAQKIQQYPYHPQARNYEKKNTEYFYQWCQRALSSGKNHVSLPPNPSKRGGVLLGK